MKKIVEQPRLETGPIKLYLNDILAIVEVFNELDEEGYLGITIGGYLLSNVNELSQLKPKEYQEIEIEFMTNAPHSSIKLTVRDTSTRLTCYSEDGALALRGVFAKAEKIILACKRKGQTIKNYSWVAYIPMILIIPFVILWIIFHEPILSYIFYSILIGGLIISLLGVFTLLFIKSRIILIDRIEQGTFWKRNKDKIYLMIISSTITFILGILSVLVIQWISN